MDNWGRRTLTPRGRRTGLFLMERRGQVRSTGEREAGPAAQHFITGSFICVCLRSAGQTELGVTGSESVRQWLAAALVSATHLRSPPKRTNGGQCGETHHTKPKTHTTHSQQPTRTDRRNIVPKVTQGHLLIVPVQTAHHPSRSGEPIPQRPFQLV